MPLRAIEPIGNLSAIHGKKDRFGARPPQRAKQRIGNLWSISREITQFLGSTPRFGALPIHWDDSHKCALTDASG